MKRFDASARKYFGVTSSIWCSAPEYVPVNTPDGANKSLGSYSCNDFGGQEPGSLEEIKSFCSTTYNASFELFDKVHATGSTTEPYTTLNKTEPSGDVAWNFEKFLVGKDGTVIARFKSGVEPDSDELKNAIKSALAA